MTATSKLIRAAITDAEWAAMRKLAIDREVPTSELVGQTLRRHLIAKPPTARRGGSR